LIIEEKETLLKEKYQGAVSGREDKLEKERIAE
jgi:hypothetical protein